MKHEFKPHGIMFATTEKARQNNQWHDAEELARHVAVSMFGERFEQMQPRRFALDKFGFSFDISMDAIICPGDIFSFLNEINSTIGSIMGAHFDSVWTCDPWVNADPETGDGAREGDQEERIVIFCKACDR